MAESLWDGIDAYLVSALTADLGAAAGHASLAVQTVVNTAEWEPRSWTFPVAIVNGETVSIAETTHFDGNLHGDLTYQYVLAAVVSTTSYASARAGAKVLGKRLMDSMLGRVALGGLADDGGTERVQDTRLVRMEHFVWPDQGNRNVFYGMARLDMDIHTTR